MAYNAAYSISTLKWAFRSNGVKRSYWAWIILVINLVRATNSNSRDLEEIHQRKLFYEKYPRDVQSNSVKASPVASSSTKSTPTSETRSNDTTSVTEKILENTDSTYLEANLEKENIENNDFDLPPLEEIPKLPERLLDTTMDNR